MTMMTKPTNKNNEEWESNTTKEPNKQVASKDQHSNNNNSNNSSNSSRIKNKTPIKWIRMLTYNTKIRCLLHRGLLKFKYMISEEGLMGNSSHNDKELFNPLLALDIE